MVLDQIQNVNDIKNLTEEEIDTLQDEIRTFLVESIAKTGGHLASNLGVIELTMALHLSFDLRQDCLGCRTSVVYAQDSYRTKGWV